jgi:hypothetical protein
MQDSMLCPQWQLGTPEETSFPGKPYYRKSSVGVVKVASLIDDEGTIAVGEYIYLL